MWWTYRISAYSHMPHISYSSSRSSTLMHSHPFLGTSFRAHLPLPLRGGLGRAQRTRTPKDRSGSGLTRKGATRSAGTVAFSGVPGVNVPEGTVVTAPNG